MSDEEFVDLVEGLDRDVAKVDGHGFTSTPFDPSAALSGAIGLLAPGGVWVKNETVNVSGSHKGRHLMGLAILAEVESRLGAASGARAKGQRLAIASCGNAALGAAVIARAAGKALDVFIPTDANPEVVARLETLGAKIHVCPRKEGAKGDPCYRAFRERVADGALPFCCQGSDNGLTIEGGETLAWEIIEEMLRHGSQLDRIFVQVGGGALASACVAGFRDAVSLGVPVRMPRLYPVQTRGAFPLRRAWEKIASRIVERLGVDPGAGDHAVAESIRKEAGSKVVGEVLDFAARHRSDFMWPWETEPKSVAHGILDDETYDWLAVVRGTIETGGFPVVVGEARLLEAHAMARECTGIDVDPTGSAGLAGLLELSLGGELDRQEAVAVLFTGSTR
jgi:threonine synthase